MTSDVERLEQPMEYDKCRLDGSHVISPLGDFCMHCGLDRIEW